MTHAIRNPFFLFAGFCWLLLVGCSKLPKYKVTDRSPGVTRIELEGRITLDDLYGIAKKEKPDGQGLLQVLFSVPAEYPGAQTPWAQMTFTRVSETRELSSLSVYGACTDKHRDSLLGIAPGPGYQVLGKWHRRDPMTEAVYIIKQKDTALLLERHLAGKYLETEQQPLPVCGVWADDRGVKDMKAPAFEGLLPIDLPLTRTDAQTFRQKDGAAGYRMLPNGNLECLDDKGEKQGEAVKIP